MIDYYDELQVKRCSDRNIINKQFLKLGIFWHPNNINNENNNITHKFDKLCEAYSVLSNPKLKSIYDKYGYDKLKSGIYENNFFIKGYKYNHDSILLFDRFYVNNNHVSNIYNDLNIPYDSIYYNNPKIEQSNVKDIEIDIDVTIKEIYNGCYKRVNYKRIIFNKELLKYQEIDDFINIQIIERKIPSNKIIFERKGNQDNNENYSNLIINTNITNYNNYSTTPESNKLYYNYKIGLKKALSLTYIKLKRLDNTELIYPIKNTSLLSNNIIIKNEGLLLDDNNISDLIITVIINYNDIQLTDNKIQKIIEVLN